MHILTEGCSKHFIYQYSSRTGASFIEAKSSSSNINAPDIAWFGGSGLKDEFFASELEKKPWLQIHVEPMLGVSGIIIKNRKDEQGESFENVQIRAGSSSSIQDNDVVGTFKGPGVTGGEQYIQFSKRFMENGVEYVTIEITSESPAVLAVDGLTMMSGGMPQNSHTNLCGNVLKVLNE